MLYDHNWFWAAPHENKRQRLEELSSVDCLRLRAAIPK
jgi:hypothetical protein